MQQHYRPLGRCPPDQLAAFSLTVLHVDVAPGIFQAAILERAVDENPVIQDQVLILEDLVFVSSHEKTRLPPRGGLRKLTSYDSSQAAMPAGRTISTATLRGEASEACTRVLSRCSASA